MDQTRGINQFGLRLQPDLKEWLALQAKKAKRSLNSEIAIRLEESKEKQEGMNHE